MGSLRRATPSVRRCAAIALALWAVVVAGCAPPQSSSPSTSTSTSTSTSPPSSSPPPTASSVYDAACRDELVASTPGTVASADVVELSGISASQKNDGVWWVHNDSENPRRLPRVFAVGAGGLDLGEFVFATPNAVDTEDIAVGPGPDAGVSYIYLADIGDSPINPERTNVKVYRVPEPTATVVDPPLQSLSGVATLTLTYPNGPHDAEALIVDPVSHDLFVVTKELNGIAQVFSTSANFANGANAQLVAAGTVALGGLNVVTGGDVTPVGDVVALRTYSEVYLLQRPSGSALAGAFARVKCAAPTGTEPPLTGEAIGFTSDGKGYVTSYEGSHPQLHQFRAP